LAHCDGNNIDHVCVAVIDHVCVALIDHVCVAHIDHVCVVVIDHVCVVVVYHVCLQAHARHAIRRLLVSTASNPRSHNMCNILVPASLCTDSTQVQQPHPITHRLGNSKQIVLMYAHNKCLSPGPDQLTSMVRVISTPSTVPSILAPPSKTTYGQAEEQQGCSTRHC
jgi:hypothetical protein